MKIPDSTILKSRAAELFRLSEKNEYEFVTGPFLSPAEQAEFSSSIFSQRLFFWGGAVGADRRKPVFVPVYIDLSDAPMRNTPFSAQREEYFAALLEYFAPEETLGIVPVSVKGSTFVQLHHKDYMGSVLGLGLDRSVVGDIAVIGDYEALIMADEKITPFILSHLDKIGRDSVKCSVEAVRRDFKILRKFQRLHLAAGSDRADSITASLGNFSRAEAKEMCISSLIEINYISEIEPDARVSAGDIISIRGCGKFVVVSFDGETKSGRLKITADKYI